MVVAVEAGGAMMVVEESEVREVLVEASEVDGVGSVQTEPVAAALVEAVMSHVIEVDDLAETGVVDGPDVVEGSPVCAGIYEVMLMVVFIEGMEVLY